MPETEEYGRDLDARLSEIISRTFSQLGNDLSHFSMEVITEAVGEAATAGMQVVRDLVRNELQAIREGQEDASFSSAYLPPNQRGYRNASQQPANRATGSSSSELSGDPVRRNRD